MNQTLDKIFQKVAENRPDQCAISERVKKLRLGQPAIGEISYHQADQYVKFLSSQFRQMGFKEGNIILTQLPNIAETPLVLLALMDAGLIPGLIPGHWRLSELSQAIKQLKPSALCVPAKFAHDKSDEGLYDLAMEHISLRYIFGLGDNLPDGLTPLPTLIDSDHLAANDRQSERAILQRTPDHVACIGWSQSENGTPSPLAYTHRQLSANAALLNQKFSVPEAVNILTPYAPTSLPGLIGMTSWINNSGTLHLTETLNAAKLASTFEKDSIDLAFLPEGLRKDMPPQTRPTTHIAFIANSPVRKAANEVQNKPAVVPTNTGDNCTSLYNLNGLCLIAAQNPPLTGLLKLGPQETGNVIGEDNRGNDDNILLEARLQGATQKAGTHGSIMKGRLEISGSIVAFAGNDAFLQTSAIPATSEHWEQTHLTAYVIDGAMSALEIEQNDKTIFHGNAQLSSEELDRLYQAYPGFVDAAAFSIKDPLMGERLFAAIIPQPGNALSYDDFKKHLESQHISPAKIPEKLVMVAEIPRTAEGLVARGEIMAAPSH